MRKPLTIAKLLAKEAAYRFSKHKRGIKILSNPTLTNILALVFFTIFSVGSATLNILIDKHLSTPTPLVATTVVQVAIAIFSTIFLMAYNLHIIVTDKLIDTFIPMPIETKDFKYALILLNMYWGVYAEPFLFIPGSLIYLYYTGKAEFLLIAIELSIFTILLTLTFGFLAGSVSPRTLKNPVIRVLATFIWIIFMGIGFIISGASRFLEIYLTGAQLTFLDTHILRYLPPLSMIYQIYDTPIAIITSLLSIILLLPIMNLSIDKYWTSLFKTQPAKPKHMIKVKSINYKMPTISAWIYKDLKTLARKPRFLASTIYLLLFPMIMPLLIGYTSVTLIMRNLAPLFILSLGAFSGGIISTFYIIEGEGARLLYTLPITKKDFIYKKSMTVLYLSIIASTPIAIYAYALWQIPIHLILLLCITYILSTYSSSILIANIHTDYIPEEPSPWTQYTFSGLGISLKIFGVIALYIVLSGVAAIPHFLNILSQFGIQNIDIPKYLIDELTSYIESYIILLLLLSIGIHQTNRKNESL